MRRTIAICVTLGVCGGIIGGVRALSGSWTAALFWLYVGLVLFLVLLTALGIYESYRQSDFQSLATQSAVRTGRGIVEILAAVALAVSGWPGLIVAIVVAWPRGQNVPRHQVAAAVGASYFGVAALATAGVQSVANLVLYRVDPRSAARFACLWTVSIVLFLGLTAIVGRNLINTIRQSPGPTAPRFMAASVGTLTALVTSIAVLDAHHHRAPVDLARIEQTAKQILFFKKVLENFASEGVSSVTTIGWFETSVGALYWVVISSGVLKLTRRAADHVKVANTLLVAGRPDEALRHLKCLKEPTNESKRLEGIAYLGLSRRDDAIRLAGESRFFDDRRTPCEILAENVIFPNITERDALFLLHTIIEEKIPDVRLALVLTNILYARKVPASELEAIVSTAQDSLPRSYSKALLLLEQNRLYEAAACLPNELQSPMEEFLTIGFRLPLNAAALDDAAMEGWLDRVSTRALTEFRKLVRYEALAALGTLSTLLQFSRGISERSTANVRRGWDAALSICRDSKWIRDEGLTFILTSAKASAATLLEGRLRLRMDPLEKQRMHGLLLFAEQRFAEAAAVLDPIVRTGGADPSLSNVLSRAYVRMGTPSKGVDALKEQAQRTASGERWADLGDFCFELGDFETALQAYDSALGRGFDAARLMRARTLARLRRADEARREFAVCAETDSRFDVKLEFAEFLVHSGDVRAAEELLRSMVHARPDLGKAQIALAQLVARRSRHAAVTLMEEALARAPDDPMLLEEASSLMATVEPDKAISCLEHLSALRGTSDALVRLGNLLFDQERYQDARTRYEGALAKDPGNIVARYNLGLTLERLSDAQGAERAFRENVRADPRSGARLEELASYLKRHGRLDEANAELLKAMEIEPERSHPVALYAEWLHESGRSEEAAVRLRAASHKFGEDDVIVRTLANIALDQGDFAQALDLRRRSAEKSEDLETWLFLGDAYLQAGDSERATAAYERALLRWPDDPRATARFARALWSKGKLEDAERLYVSNTVLHGDLASSWLDLAQFFTETKRFDEARVAVHKAKDVDPKNFDVYLAMPAVLAQSLGNAELARLLREGAKVVRTMSDLLEAAAEYYTNGSPLELVRRIERINSVRGADFLNAIVWDACVQGRVDANMRALAARAAQVRPIPEILHTLSVAEFMAGDNDEAWKSFERFVTSCGVHFVNNSFGDIALLLRTGIERGATARLIDVLREARNAAIWRDWADALSAVALDVAVEKLSPAVAERVAQLKGSRSRIVGGERPTRLAATQPATG